MNRKLHAELHCHSEYSFDCDLSLTNIIQACQKRKIDVIALTDHNTIEGAIKLQTMAPEWLKVIIGEEIATEQGDIIGLFIKEKINSDQDIRRTIAQIKEQGGIVMLPHPFDYLRGKSAGAVVTDAIKNEIDFIEIYNARNYFNQANKKTVEFAQDNDLDTYVGSDAHSQKEYGSALNIIDDYSSGSEFKSALSVSESKINRKFRLF